MLYHWAQGIGRKVVGGESILLPLGDTIDGMLVQSGNGLGLQAENTLQALNPLTQLPFGSESIYLAGTVAMPIVGATAVILSYRAPSGYNAIVNALQIVYTGGSFVNGSGELLFRVKIDGRPIRSLGNINGQIGTINQTEPIAPIKLNAEQTMTIEVFHTANAALLSAMNGRIGGYIYPITQ